MVFYPIDIKFKRLFQVHATIFFLVDDIAVLNVLINSEKKNESLHTKTDSKKSYILLYSIFLYLLK